MARELRRGGYAPDWTRVETREEYLGHLAPALDLILADYTLPSFDALEALRLLREAGLDICFIVVTEAVSEEAAVGCMRSGADDYLLKDRLANLGPAVGRALQDRARREEKRSAAEALRESEETYRMLMEHAGIGIGYWSAQGKLLLLNHAAAAQLNGAPRDFIGKHASEIFDSTTASQIGGRIAAVLGRDESQEYVDLVPLPAGPKWFLSTYGRILDSRGEISGAQILSHDVSARKRVEEALENERNLLRTLTRNVPDPMYLKDTESRFLFANEPLAEFMAGGEPDLVIGKTDRDFYPREVAERLIKEEKEIMRTGRPLLDKEEEVRTLRGTVRWYLTTKVPLRDPSGGITGLVGISRDITELKKREREARELSTAIERTPDSVLITDATGSITFVNPGFESITGYSRQEALGSTVPIIRSGVHDEAFYTELWEGVRAGRVWVGRIVNRRKDGSLYQEQKTIAPILDEAGRFVGSVEIGRDVTEEVELETRLRQSQKVEAIGQLAGGVAHDFNNMLQVIGGYLEVLSWKGAVAEESRPYLEEIRTATDRAGRLTQQLLAFSRRQVLELKPLDLNDAVANLLKMIQRVIGEHIRLSFQPGVGLATVTADAAQLDQVLLNLCLNARDAMPDGGTLTIGTEMTEIGSESVTIHPWTRPGRSVQLSVTDTGRGMDAETLSRVFEPFFTTKEPGKGTGLGLATVYGIVKQHQGVIHASSEPGKGSTFRIYLPAREDAVSEGPPAAEEQPVPGGSEMILLAEDEESIRHLAIRTLEGAGYRVLVARDGEEATTLFHANENEISLAVMDVVMPRLGGHEAADRMRSRRPDLPVLFASGYSAEAEVTRLALEVRGTELIQKPFNLKDLLRRVRRMIDGGERPDARTRP